ncbi:MAG: hypothetical protein AAFV26_02580, partial [Pseudomonadota bacterium]
MIFWILTIPVSIVLLVLTAAARGSEPQLAWLHLAISAFVAISFALIAIREGRELLARNAEEVEISATMARFMGLVWAWGALALAITYATGIVTWVEWPGFFIAFAVAAGLSFFVSFRLRNQDGGDSNKAGMLKIGRYLAIGQLVGMVIV